MTYIIPLKITKPKVKVKDLGDKLYICENMLKSDEDIFLDNIDKDYKMRCDLNTNYSNISFGKIIVSNSAQRYINKTFNKKELDFLNTKIAEQKKCDTDIFIDLQIGNFLYGQIPDINYWTGQGLLGYFFGKTKFIERLCKKLTNLKSRPLIFNISNNNNCYTICTTPNNAKKSIPRNCTVGKILFKTRKQ